MRIAFSATMLSLMVVAVALGFIVGLHSTMLRPDVVDRPGARRVLPRSTLTAMTAESRDPEPSLENPYRRGVLLLGIIAVSGAIILGSWLRMEGDQGARAVANTMVGLGVVALLLLAVETAVVVFMPLMDTVSQLP